MSNEIPHVTATKRGIREISTLVGNPNLGLKPSRRRSLGHAAAGTGFLRLPAQAVLRSQSGRRRRRAQLRLP